VTSEESTTPDLVELARDTIACANRGDVDAMMSLFAPDAVWRMTPLSMDFEGMAGIRGFVEDWLGSYEEYAVQPDEIFDLGNGVTFAVTHQEGRPVGSSDGALVVETWAYVFVWVDGKLARLTSYDDIDEARAAAELLSESRA
jgi:ketosteroid isomerase-like protein